MLDKISDEELEYVVRLKASNGRAIGPSPLRRKKFGFYTPSEKYEAVLNRLLQPRDQWLDLGGGRDIFPHNAILSEKLVQRCSRIVGIDPSSNIHENPYLTERFQGFLEDYTGQRGFNLISLRMVVEHVSDPPSLVAQISKSLRAGGYVIILTVWDYSPITWISWMTPSYAHFPIKKFFWGGEEKDTFPVKYRMNSLFKLKQLFAREGMTPEMLELVADCSATNRWPMINSIELSAWSVLRTIGLPYPESNILAVFRKNE